MTGLLKKRQPSPLQRRVLIVLAALDAKRPGPVATRDIERMLAQGGEDAVYGNNLRASCRRMEETGWLRTLRAPNLQLAVELTPVGREQALPLLADEQARVRAEQRASQVRVLPLVPLRMTDDADTETPAHDLPVELAGSWYMVCRGDFVIRLDGTTCLQLWNTAGQVTRLAGDPLQISEWLQACHDAGIGIRMQVNESVNPDEGTVEGHAPIDRTDTWYRQLERALQAQGITGLTETIRLAVVRPGESHRVLAPPARLLHALRESPEVYPLTAVTFETDTEAALADLLARAGFTPDQTVELQWRLIRYDFARQEMNILLDELAQCQLYCRREQLVTRVFSPDRNPGGNWTECLQVLLPAEASGFYSPLSRERATRALDTLARYVSRAVVEQLADGVAWESSAPDEQNGA